MRNRHDNVRFRIVETATGNFRIDEWNVPRETLFGTEPSDWREVQDFFPSLNEAESWLKEHTTIKKEQVLEFYDRNGGKLEGEKIDTLKKVHYSIRNSLS